MSKSKSDSGGADLSDYKFWRSQHRPMGDEAGAEPPAKVDVFADAVANRLGEETGQSLHGLIWPQVPEKWKNLVSVLGGRIAPMVAIGKLAVKGGRKVYSDLNPPGEMPWLNYFRVEIDGKEVTPDWETTGDLFEQLCSAKLFWEVRMYPPPHRSALARMARLLQVTGDPPDPFFAILLGKDQPAPHAAIYELISPVLKFDVAGISEAAGGVLQVDNMPLGLEAAGVKLESGSQQHHLLALQRFELLRQFLVDQLTFRPMREYRVCILRKELEASDIDLSNDDWIDHFSQLDPKTLENLGVLAIAFEWHKLVTAAL